MKGNAGLIEINKCVASRLWYTSWTTLIAEIDSRTDRFTQDEILHLVSLLESDPNVQNNYEDRWIIWKISELLRANNEAAKPKHIEFLLAVKFLTEAAPSEVEKELLDLFKLVLDSKKVKEKVGKLSNQSRKLLEENLRTCPPLACFVVQSLLCVWSPFFNESDVELQNLYINGLKKFLNADQTVPRKSSSGYLEVKAKPLLSSNDRKLDDQSVGTLLSILSKLQLTEDNNDQLMTWLFPSLFANCDNRDVELALYTRRSSEYLKEWFVFINEILKRSESADSIENALGISNAIFNFTNAGDVRLNFRELVYRTIKQSRHWLLDILDICYTLLAAGYIDKVSMLLSAPNLEGLWLAVFFKVLSNLPCASRVPVEADERVSLNFCKGLRFVLEKCQLYFGEDKIWRELKTVAISQLNVVEWVLNNKKTVLEKEFGYELKKDLTMKNVFSLLLDNGILFTLNSMTDLHEGNSEEIQQLLKNSPCSEATFKAYYAMLCALRAILLSDSYSFKAQSVGDRLAAMRNTLKNLFPLNIRLEAIENIFSMLFLRHEDFSNTDSNSEDSEEEADTKKVLQSDYKLMQSGFICNKYIIRDLLHSLKDAILNAGIECTKMKLEPGSQDSTEHVRKSLANISRAVTDAIWRLELLTSSQFIERVGDYGSQTSKNEDERCYSETLLTKKLKTSKLAAFKSIFYHQDDSSSSEDRNKSELEFSSDAGSLDTGNTNCASGTRKKHGKKNAVEKSPVLDKNYSFILNFMLSSRESLIMQCLWKCNFDKAQQVIEMFHLNNSQLDGEVRFSKAICQFRHRMKGKPQIVSTPEAVNRTFETSTLENIRQVALEGIQTSRAMGEVETFLASNESVLRLINPDEVKTNELLTIAVLDLALTTGQSRSFSSQLCEVATKYMKLCKIIEKSLYPAYFTKICKLFYESKLNASLPSILCDASVPLTIKKFNEKVKLWNEVEKVVTILNLSRLERGKAQKERSHNRLTTSQEGLAFVSEFCNGGAYLSKLFTHLSVLETIIPRTENERLDETLYAMLVLPIHSYFGHQYFDLGVELDQLDSVAKKLRVNLVHSLLVSCCPKFPFNEKLGSGKSTNKIGYIVLNEDLADSMLTEYDMEKPHECVAGILTLLLDTISNIYPSNSVLRYNNLQSLSKNSDILSILRRTSCLANLNLCELTSGDETLTFFLNLWNLLFLHSMLTTWSANAPCNKLQHVVSMMNIGYQIGELGLVTLATLRFKLLGNLSWDLEFLKQIEDVNEVAWQDLDLIQDPRLIFAMANEFSRTPMVFVYDSRNLDQALNAAIQNYIAHHHLIQPAGNDTKIDLCWLPEMVRRYQDFLLENASLAQQTLGCNFDESFTLRKFLNTNVENSIELKYSPQVRQYEIRLNYTGIDHSITNSLQNVRRSSNNIHSLNHWQGRTVDEKLLQYFEAHCWLLRYLVQQIHRTDPAISEKMGDNTGRCGCLENLLRSSFTKILSNAFGENQAMFGMHEDLSQKELWAHLERLIKKDKWEQCLNVINCLPDNLMINDGEIFSLKDKILSILVSSLELDDKKVIEYLRQIKNIHVLACTVSLNLTHWRLETCQYALTYVLNHSDKTELSGYCQEHLDATMRSLVALHKMIPQFGNSLDMKHVTWYGNAYSTNKVDPMKIMKSLIEANKFELCLEWFEYHSFSSEMQSLVNQDLLIGLLENDRKDFEPATKLLRALPINRAMKLCNGVLSKLDSITAIKFVTNYLLDRCKPKEAVKYHKILVSIEILSQLDYREKSAFIHLLKEPLLMLEQLLMNGKFEVLHKILKLASDSLPKASILPEDTDKIVRYYAGKSLEFRVAMQRDGIESKSKDSSSSSNEIEGTEFMMPVTVPTKDEWVANDKARVCSCCKAVVFSMFNRRHHCRRCGRVICAVCSQQRMRVPTYPDSVLVRVCNDCKRQTLLRLQHAPPSTPSSEPFDYWQLTLDETLNQTLRDEFSFEYAPSISLCLAILTLHSDHKAYASFLLDRCDEIKQLLRPVSSGRTNPEVDLMLLVKMMRSLVIAAKVKCAKLSLNAGLDHCDRWLSHIDLISTLVQSDCSALIPSDSINERAFRKLRDLLIEKEHWILALDVSTKAGLDRQGVWAVWGKAYLKVGCYNQAREKFAHCLDKVESFDDWVFLPNSRQTDNNKSRSSARTGDKQRSREKTRPMKNPPLLVEILQIIESSTFNRHSCKAVTSTSFTALDVSITLNNIKAISQGRCYDLEPASITDTAYYHESLHYLLSYGSHSAILEFFIKHEKYEDCILHVMGNHVDPEVFFSSVYLPCLKNGLVDNLHEAMRTKDPNLLSWKTYLVFTCHSLETKKLLHTLYQLQIFIKDYVRASISCIRFYVNEAADYTDLCSRSQFLIQAQKHLETELQANSLGPKRRKSTGSQHSGQSALTLELEPSDIDKHINTISSQMEIAKFLRDSEQEQRDVRKFLDHLLSMENENLNVQELPTLFGTQLQKTQLAVLAILCGRDVEEGFGIAYRIIQNYNLRSEKVYSLAGHILASEQKVGSLEQLVKCCRSSGAPETNALSDRVLAHCVKVLLKYSQMESSSNSKDKVDTLIKLITDLELKISMYIESQQLKAAYLLAVRHSRAQDVKRILKEADRLEQTAIKAICAKWLHKMQNS
ncbi:uncharacterized protein Sptz isoform X1 [Neodiprion pinetum]|uniref:uncharacterized protein Sptz isoform X1 n=1 Tax=Neodiprion pinetum TaxID=441929 RepID=UPI001EE09CF0|nr:uncharacterized protein LOC124222734 isoform X1 [Neodiprion pinetum]